MPPIDRAIWFVAVGSGRATHAMGALIQQLDPAALVRATAASQPSMNDRRSSVRTVRQDSLAANRS
jgi:hypothetical protein